MKALVKLVLATAVLSFLVGVATVPVESSYASRAVLMQRMQKSAGDDLFGDQGTAIGSPQQFIVDDPKAILNEKGQNGVTLLDENYLLEHKIHPLELQTVHYVAGLIRTASLGVGVVLLILGLFLRARGQQRISPQSE